jgi:hypothetical protein
MPTVEVTVAVNVMEFVISTGFTLLSRLTTVGAFAIRKVPFAVAL